jgi:hypothetical protein
MTISWLGELNGAIVQAASIQHDPSCAIPGFYTVARL